MSRVHVLVAATSPDIKAECICAAIARRTDMTLIENYVATVAKVDLLFKEPASSSLRYALVLVGPKANTEVLAARWLVERADLVILRVDIIDDVMHITLRDPSLDELLTALCELIDHASRSPQSRVLPFKLQSKSVNSESDTVASQQRPLLDAAIGWLHAVLRDAINKLAVGDGDLPGLTITAATITNLLSATPTCTASTVSADVSAADAVLTQALTVADKQSDPLAAVAHEFSLTATEFRLLLLALAPELDPRYQRCIGLLLDDLSRRVGTLGTCMALLGEPLRVRCSLAKSGHLVHWRLLDWQPGNLPPADEPLRIDPSLTGWLLGEAGALEQDPRVRRAIRLFTWPGASLFARPEDSAYAAKLVNNLQAVDDPQWLILAGDHAPTWRALLELGAETRHAPLIRVEAAHLVDLDIAELEETGIRLGRLARLTHRPLVVDATTIETMDNNTLRLLLATLGSTGCQVGIICTDAPRLVGLLGAGRLTLIDSSTFPMTIGAATVRAAAKGINVLLSDDAATRLAHQYALQADELEQAMRLASTHGSSTDDEEKRFDRFVAACREVAAQGVSQLAERIDPMFELTDVVLPADRSQQLDEIVSCIRLASTVLDGWKFRDQLPYGRGITALFHGPSGTGKTMAALAIARKLGIQILRLDLSRVVNKYIGETEKNIDRVFADAQRCGAAILIDEADALLGKRSEVKDAHDRYANIEVAFLLQRMEAYEGLAILTTNMRQNLDQAFLRRLRFIVDFPKPDADAREKIWRRCLPAGSHELDDTAFRQLARKIDLTGGHIRQISLRAAFAAADTESKIGLVHIAHAARAEFAKVGKPPVEIDLTVRSQAA